MRCLHGASWVAWRGLCLTPYASCPMPFPLLHMSTCANRSQNSGVVWFGFGNG